MALLGRLPDEAVALRAGVSAPTVRDERRRRGIEPFRRRGPVVTWTEEMVALLGTDTDSVVADALGLTAASVNYRRRLVGIPAYGGGAWGPRSKVRWRPRMLALLGTASDDVVAKRLGLSRQIVWWKRQQLGIPPLRTERPIVRTKRLKDLLVLPSQVLARKHGLSSKVIAKLRREYGVNAPGWATNRWTPEVLARLGREPDTVIARELGVTTASVLSKRRTLGIPALLDDPEVQVARPDEPGLLTAPGSTS